MRSLPYIFAQNFIYSTNCLILETQKLKKWGIKWGNEKTIKELGQTLQLTLLLINFLKATFFKQQNHQNERKLLRMKKITLTNIFAVGLQTQTLKCSHQNNKMVELWRNQQNIWVVTSQQLTKSVFIILLPLTRMKSVKER